MGVPIGHYTALNCWKYDHLNFQPKDFKTVKEVYSIHIFTELTAFSYKNSYDFKGLFKPAFSCARYQATTETVRHK